MKHVEQTVKWLTQGFGMAAESVRKRHLIAKSLLIGVVAGACGAFFRAAPEAVERAVHALRQSSGLPLWLAPVFAAGAGAFSVWVVRRFAPEAGGGGLPHLRACLAGRIEFRWARVIVVKIASLLSGIAGGLGLGGEAPAIHAGGACGRGLAHLLHSPKGVGEHRALISAGAAAGLSAAFNAPLAGVIFVLEELQGDFSTPVLVCSVLASAVADVLTRQIFGHPPVFHLHGAVWPGGVGPLLGAMLLGLIAGVAGGIFNRWVVGCARLGRVADRDGFRTLLGAGAAAISTWFALRWPGVSGGGAPLVEMALGHALPLATLATLAVLRFGSTLLATASGAAGGFMIPLLALGALTGRMLGDLWAAFLPNNPPPVAIFVAVGMGAFFSSSVRAPLTGLVLVLELTGDYGFMLPALIACIVAFLTAEELGIPAVYHSLAASSDDEAEPGETTA